MEYFVNKKFLFLLLLLSSFFKPAHAINAELVATVISSTASAPCYYMAIKFGMEAFNSNTRSNATKSALLLGGGLIINYAVAACATRSLTSSKTVSYFYQGALIGGIWGSGAHSLKTAIQAW